MTFTPYIDVLNRTIGASLGRPLASVTYRTYEDTISHAAVSEGAGWIHGEVLLEFEHGLDLFLGWGENEGWPDHFSLLPSLTSTFEPGALADIRASEAPEWRAVIAQPLIAAEVLGRNGTPHVLVLRFPAGGVVISDGYEGDLGDGDQVMIHLLSEPQLATFTEVFWRVSESAV
jgi:hypothetical protein